MNDFFTPIEEQLEEAEASWVKREPVLLTGLISGPVLGLVTWLGAGNPGKTADQVTAAIVAAVISLVSWGLRQHVAPAWKALTGRDLPTEVTDEQDDEPEPGDTETVGIEEMHPHHAARLAGRPQPGKHRAEGD